MELKVNKGWKKRLARALTPTMCGWTCSSCLKDNGLSADEIERLLELFQLVKKAADKMYQNMIKGVLKYPDTTRSVAEWLELGIDDGTDGLMYLYLARQATQ
tara:strand:+ start:58 stop:363 length:306 start_codon:yes stop_codon:yes gene_type:complete